MHEFFVAARQLGFSDVELNHQISPAMLVGIDLKGYRFSSIHEPCPTDISTETLKRRDWLISSFDDDCRRQGVAAVKRSIDLANELGAKTVVMHAGNVVADGSLENDLRALFKSGQSQTPKYSETTNSLIELRAKSSGRHLEAVKRSLIELLEYAGHCAVRLGLENRYHYLDIPTQDEMALLLDMAGPDQLGFVYDVGHAQAMDRLGFYPHEMWLKRYARRIFGVHLHDVIGIDDHHAPGVGDVDFCMVATYLPEDAFRTYELDARNSTERVKTGLKFLVKHGCIKRL